LGQAALAVVHGQHKEVTDHIPLLVRLLLPVVAAGVVMDRAYKMARMAALEVVAVGITMCKLLLDRATLQAQLLLKATMAETLRLFKTTAVAGAALAR
jgi:hypothetical protein